MHLEDSNKCLLDLQTNLLEVAKQIVHDRKVKEVAGDEPQIRDMSHRELIDRIPGQDLRPGAFKMQLRAREEAQLPLVRHSLHNLLVSSVNLDSSRVWLTAHTCSSQRGLAPPCMLPEHAVKHLQYHGIFAAKHEKVGIPSSWGIKSPRVWIWILTAERDLRQK